MENDNNKNQRILSYAMSYKLSEEDLLSVSAAMGTHLATYMPNGSLDAAID